MMRRCSSYVVALGLTLIMIAVQSAQAQTYTVIHNFSGGGDGGTPLTGLALDHSGNLYGTTSTGGAGQGGVFRLKHQGSGWLFNPLYSFAGGSDGSLPFSPVAFGPDGSIYGTTYQAGLGSCGGGNGCGTAFKLQPALSACKSALCPWVETVLYRFTGGSDGGNPTGHLTFDSAGNIYATARVGADAGCSGIGCGTVYKLTRSGNSWTQSVLYSFTGGSDQGLPDGGVILDHSGNLYGEAQGCYGGNYGTIFQLSPGGSGYTYTQLVTFAGGSLGQCPAGGLIMDQSGKIYASTALGSGSVDELTPTGGGFSLSLVYDLPGGGSLCGPYADLVMDSAGNLYGTTLCNGAHNLGTVFKLTPSGGSWAYTDLHDFTGSDGATPYSNLVIDSSGKIYGTTSAGGSSAACAGGCGVVFEITP